MYTHGLHRRDILKAGVALAATGSVGSFLSACGDGDDAASGGLTYLNASSGQEKALQTINKRYEQQTGVRIELTTQALDYPQTLQSRAQAQAMPDLYYPGQTGSLVEHAPYVKGGWPLDLTAEMDAGWRDSFRPELLAYTTYENNNAQNVKPGIYSVPFDGNNWQVLANPELWEKAGLDPARPPADWDGLITTLTALKKATSQPFAMNLGQPYGTTAFVTTYGSSVMSVDEMTATFKGQTPWSTEGWRKVLSLYEQLRDAGVVAAGSVTWKMPDLEQAFFSRKTLASYFGFAISVPVGNRLAPDFKNYSTFLPPPVEPGGEIKIAGGMGKSVAVNSRSDNAEAAVKYLKWFTEPEQQKEYAQLLPTIPGNPKVAAEKASLDRRILPFNEAMNRILPPQVSISAKKEEVLNRGVQQLFNKDTTIDKILKSLDDTTEGS